MIEMPALFRSSNADHDRLESQSLFMGHEYRSEFIQAFRVPVVESADERTIQIEHAKQSLAVKQRHHDLRVRSHVAGDVTRKLMHIRHDDRLTLLRGHTADAFAHRNTNTRRIALKWTKHQLVFMQKIEPGPIHIRQRIEK